MKPIQSLAIVLAILVTPGLLNAQTKTTNEQTVHHLLRFASPDSNLFLAFKPQTLLESPLWQLMQAAEPSERNNWFSTIPGEIELLIVIGPNPVDTLLAGPVDHFSVIADDIDDPADIELQSHQPLPVVTGIVRFHGPVTPQTLQPWLVKTTRQKYDIASWDGHEVIICEDELGLSGVRIDDRTYVISDPDSIRKGIRRTEPIATKLDRWIEAFVRSEANHDAIIATDLTQYQNRIPEGEIDPTLALIRNARFADIRLNFTKSPVATCNVTFSDDQSAKQLARVTRSSIRMARLALKMQLEEQRGSRFETMLEQSIELLNTVDVQGSGDALTITLPRPENWNSMLENYIFYVNALSEQAQANFDEIADLIDDTTPEE